MPVFSQDQVPIEFEADVATTRAIDVGQAYYLPSGHNVVVEEDTLVLEFSPSADRARTMEHAAQMMAAAGA
jgi:hypothetical protein